jgi:hypothetical protein
MEAIAAMTIMALCGFDRSCASTWALLCRGRDGPASRPLEVGTCRPAGSCGPARGYRRGAWIASPLRFTCPACVGRVLVRIRAARGWDRRPWGGASVPHGGNLVRGGVALLTS